MSSRSERDVERALPRGVVTFLLTDVESSTRLWREAPDAAALMARQAELIGAAIAEHGGVRPLEQGEGDSVLAAFERPSGAVAAALAAQRALAAEAWAEGGVVRVRMALHTGEAMLRDADNYGGTAIIRAARLRGLAHGGQVLVSSATAALVADGLPDGAELAALDTVTLAGFDASERVFQLRHPALTADFAPLRHSPVRRLPAWPTALVGRLREREEVGALLAANRLVTIIGAGGSGKTRLAHAVAVETATRWRDGVVWVELARLTSGEQVASTVATACGAPDAGLLPALDVLARHLAESELLLVLDNCEHLLGDCAQLADAALRAAPSLTVLATSREPLGVGGEASWRIPSLALPEAGEVDPERLLAGDAVRLFVERARAARPDFVLSAATAPAVARICRRLDGIPLALELAAARLRGLTVERVADGLDDRFRLFTGGARTAMARQRTLLASVERSHDLLDDDERRLFRRLAVFAAPFSLEAAEAVAADESLDQFAVLDVLTHLVDKSLVLLADDRYRLLETLRQYALARAADAGELGALRDRHLAWMRRRAAAWRFDEELPSDEAVAEAEREEPDLLAALEWSQSGERALAIELLYPIAASLDSRYANEELRGLGQRVLGRLAEGSRPWLEALAPMVVELFFAGYLEWMPAARAALDADDSLPPALRSAIEHGVNIMPGFAGRPEAFAGLRRALEDARRCGSRMLEIGAAMQLALLQVQIGERANARPYLAWIKRHVPATARLGFLVEMTHGLAAVYDGDFAEAWRLARPHVEAARDAGPVCLAGLIAMWTEDLALAQRAAQLVGRFPPSGAFDVFMALTRAQPHLLGGDLAAARRELETARVSFGPLNGNLYAACVLAQLELGEGNLDAAAALLDDIDARAAGTVLRVVCAESDLARAAWHRARGEHAAAIASAHRALALAADNEHSLLIVEGLELLAVLGGDATDLAGAARLLGAAEAFRAARGFRRRHDYARRALAELRPRLDPASLDEGARMSLGEAVAHAQRGRGERNRPAHGWNSLTPSEQRVVELVTEGLPNKEIAARLFVSVATVKTHLIHIFGKLEVRTRAELAAAAIRRGA